MNRHWLRFSELIALAAIAFAILALAGAMIYLNRTGEAFGTVLGALLLVIQAIRNIGQAQAMQSMADALAQSQPVPAPVGIPDPSFGAPKP